jgi:predicted ArsR family transcriptional regulator
MDDSVDVRSNRRNRVPRERQRERVLRLVREHDGPIDAIEVAEQLRVHVSTARFHLDALCHEGLVERTRVTRAGVGRPRTGYQASAGLDYSVLAGVLAVGLGHTAEARAHRAQRAGREWVRRMPDSRALVPTGDVEPEAYLEQQTSTAVGLFRRLGFAPALADPHGDGSSSERVIRLTACPVRNLARSLPESVCGVHLGLLQGLVDDPTAAGRGSPRRPPVSAQLEPFVEPEMCIVRLMTRTQ